MYHSTNGIWGSMVGISSTMLAMFAIFGGVLASTGGASTFIKLGQLLTGKTIGGPGKVTIISTGLFGMVSGSPQANVMPIGTFTIPLLKDSGYDSEWAAAITSTGACGGQIMPPIMGTAAFIMAQLLSVNYLAVAAAAFIPAVLYYYGAFVAVHYISNRYNIARTEKIKYH
jgi:TRAP-type uncharacterized transport system fused permease subunit